MCVSLQEKLDDLKADFEAKNSLDVVIAMRRATEDLIASGQAEGALKAGERAPDFRLADRGGKIVSCSELLRKGPLVALHSDFDSLVRRSD
jgi:hypothetical protein